jgi:5-methylthioadenosine/S-adenosylhomocysteine deaminase
VVMTMDPSVGDFARGDVLIEGRRILSVGTNIRATDAIEIDASNTIVMPGLIDTHHHQYETIQRQIIADGMLFGAWPQQSYVSVVQSIFTDGRIQGTFDLGRSPYEPEDCYISELVACWNQINAGVTTGIDTSQCSQTAAHTDAMIKGLIDSGRRSMYVYSRGRGDVPGFEYPGRLGVSTRGLGRLRSQWFNTDDQLVTLGYDGGPTPIAGPGSETGWALARSVGAWIVNHNVQAPQVVLNNEKELGPDIEFIHCTRWPSEAWKIFADKGGKVSIASLIEMQMRHGMPPIQAALDHGIVPSLSVDVETNMTPDLFSQMRAVFTLQRALAHERSLDGDKNAPQPLTCRQVLEMATMAGARCAHLDKKVGSLSPGKEADIIMLSTDAINVFPMNNAPGAVVTMMDTSNVKHVMIAGTIKKWNGKLVGANLDDLRRKAEASRDALMSRIRGVFPAYVPSLFDSCCVPTKPAPAAR